MVQLTLDHFIDKKERQLLDQLAAERMGQRSNGEFVLRGASNNVKRRRK